MLVPTCTDARLPPEVTAILAIFRRNLDKKANSGRWRQRVSAEGVTATGLRRLFRYKVTHYPRQTLTLLRRFLQVARKAKISHISEGKSLDAWAKGMGAE